MTKPETGAGENRNAVKEAYLRRLRNAPVEAVRIKLADRLSNVQHLDQHLRPDKRRAYYRETVEYILLLSADQPFFRQWYETWRARYRYLGD